MIQTTSQNAEMAARSAVRPFGKINFSEEELEDLRRRVEATRWPEKETVSDETQGVQLATIQKLAQYWVSGYDWRKCEQRLNSLPNFISEIDGLDIHFIHVRSQHENALPIILTHGWPGSIIEMLKIIEPLTNPTEYGGKEEEAFHVVIPSMPGYGFSAKPREPGWGPERIAKAWVTLMKRLGYDRFVAQGGDWGALIVEFMGAQNAPELIGIHSNMPGAIPAEINRAAHAGAAAPQELSADEKRAYEQVVFTYNHLAYATMMASRPQTLVGITDSPVGLAAFILDHDDLSYKLIAKAFDGRKVGLTRDDVLDNITLYWLTNTALSSARLYWENKNDFLSVKKVTVPVAVSAYPEELYQAPRSWAEQAFPNLIYYNRPEEGGHFAAWEQPESFTKELRAAFKTLRQLH